MFPRHSFRNPPHEGHHHPTGTIRGFPSGPRGLTYALIIATLDFASLQTGHMTFRHMMQDLPANCIKNAPRMSRQNFPGG